MCKASPKISIELADKRKVVHRELGEKKVYSIDSGYLNSILGVNDLTKNLEIAVFLSFYFVVLRSLTIRAIMSATLW